jgi:hypothetical protein
MKSLVCNKYGWTHLDVSKEYAQNATDEFIDNYQKLPDSDKNNSIVKLK